MKDGEALLAEIREVNLSYLLLAQRMLNDDFPSALFRLGFSREVGDILRRLTLPQMVRLASSSSVLCRFRLDEGMLLTTLSEDVLGGVLQQAHTALLLASQPVEQIG